MWTMLTNFRQLVMGSAGMGSLLIAGLPAAWGDCPDCQNSSAGVPPGQVYQSPSLTMPREMQVRNPNQIPVSPDSWGDDSPSAPATPSAPTGRPGYFVLPPPGTLGRTYLRTSWPIPKDEHPRTAIIQITAPGFTEIEIDGLADMEGFQRKDGVWIFKSDKPLIPGIPHIYHVKAGYRNVENKDWKVRTVRLIPGRVVTLEY